MYSYKKRVSFSEIGKDGIVPYYGILYNLQDCSTFQSEDLGIGISYLKKHHRASRTAYFPSCPRSNSRK